MFFVPHAPLAVVRKFFSPRRPSGLKIDSVLVITACATTVTMLLFVTASTGKQPAGDGLRAIVATKRCCPRASCRHPRTPCHARREEKDTFMNVWCFEIMAGCDLFVSILFVVSDGGKMVW